MHLQVLREVLTWGEKDLPPLPEEGRAAYPYFAFLPNLQVRPCIWACVCMYELSRAHTSLPNHSMHPPLSIGQGRLNTTADGDAEPVTITTASPFGTHRCFGNTTFHFWPLSPMGHVGEISIHAMDPVTNGCSDLYLLATAGQFRLERIAAPGGRHVFPWTVPADASDAERWCVCLFVGW